MCCRPEARLGFAAAWSLRRTPFTPIVSAGMPLQVLMALVALALTFAGVWLVSAAVRTLGKQWALVAHVVEDHQLITEGPYRIVRHPIYSGMFMMMIATGLVVGHWIGLVAGVVVFLAGTMWRVRIEEKLLTETFGAAYTAYRLRVPALIPWKGWGGR